MDRADLILGSLLAYALAAILHFGLAGMILARYRRLLEVRIFAWVNLGLGAWHALQLVEYGLALAPGGLNPHQGAILARAQALLLLLVLVLLFQLSASFERLYRRPPPSLRAAIITHVQRYRRFYVPLAWWSLIAAMLFYAVDSARLQAQVGQWRSLLGPLSAYLFAGVLGFLTLVLFPARPGQEQVGIANLGRGLMLAALVGSALLVMLWHDAHPARVRLAVLPFLHLQSVAFVIFFALVRYEFSFMDSYIRGAFRLVLWISLSLLTYFAFNRISFGAEGWGRYANSFARVGVLFVAIGLGPALDRRLRPWMDRVLFDRDVDLARAVHRFAGRLSRSRSMSELQRGALQDIQDALHPRSMRLLLGDTSRHREMAETRHDGEKQYRLCFSLPAADHLVGWLLLDERRNAYPWFDAERHYLSLVTELLGSALDAMGAGEIENNSGAAVRARASSRESEMEELRARLGSAQRELVSSRRALAEMRERLDPELIEQVLKITEEVGKRDAAAALDILHSLHRVYAYLLEDMGAGVSLGEEMAFAQDLMALETLRMRNRLEVSLSFDPGLRDQLVPHRVLQPVIDNALVHGLGRELHTGSIEIHAVASGAHCRISVEDNGRGFLGDLHQDALRGEGGLSRVLRSLQDLFGEDVMIRLEHPEPRGTRVCLEFPRRKLKDRRDHVACDPLHLLMQIAVTPLAGHDRGVKAIGFGGDGTGPVPSVGAVGIVGRIEIEAETVVLEFLDLQITSRRVGLHLGGGVEEGEEPIAALEHAEYGQPLFACAQIEYEVSHFLRLAILAPGVGDGHRLGRAMSHQCSFEPVGRVDGIELQSGPARQILLGNR